MLQRPRRLFARPWNVLSVLERRAEGTLYRSRSKQPKPAAAGPRGPLRWERRAEPRTSDRPRGTRSALESGSRCRIAGVQSGISEGSGDYEGDCQPDQTLTPTGRLPPWRTAYSHAARFGSGAAGAGEILCLAQRRTEGALQSVQRTVGVTAASVYWFAINFKLQCVLSDPPQPNPGITIAVSGQENYGVSRLEFGLALPQGRQPGGGKMDTDSSSPGRSLKGKQIHSQGI